MTNEAKPDEVVERVAEAIYKLDPRYYDIENIIPWDKTHLDGKKWRGLYIKQAKAAITAYESAKHE